MTDLRGANTLDANARLAIDPTQPQDIARVELAGVGRVPLILPDLTPAPGIAQEAGGDGP
jgi:hypothetical protein